MIYFKLFLLFAGKIIDYFFILYRKYDKMLFGKMDFFFDMISPFSIYCNKKNSPDGSDTNVFQYYGDFMLMYCCR